MIYSSSAAHSIRTGTGTKDLLSRQEYFFPTEVYHARGSHAPGNSGGPHDKIGDPAFGIDHLRDSAGRRASRVRYKPRQTYQKARFPDCPSGVAGCQPARSVRRGLPRHGSKFRLQDMAAAIR
jgi:hypothetical protein